MNDDSLQSLYERVTRLEVYQMMHAEGAKTRSTREWAVILAVAGLLATILTKNFGVSWL